MVHLIGADRHHENWAVLCGKEQVLAPTYDHATCLGRELPSARVAEALSTRDQRRSVEAYALRARSAFYPGAGGTKTISTLDAFAAAAHEHPADAAFWVRQLENLNWATVDAIVGRVPASLISEPHRAFMRRLLMVNKKRIINALD